MSNEPLSTNNEQARRRPAHCSLVMVRCSLFIAVWLATGPVPVAAQPTSAPPLAGRPAQFSNVVGRYSVSAAASPAEVRVEEPVTLRAPTRGSGPADSRPSRKHLKLFPERWASDFYVEPVPAEDRALPEQNTWEFVWRLRPQHRKVPAIDGIKLVYYEPGQSGAGKYQTDYAEPIALIVTAPRPAALAPDNVPVRMLPASFYEPPATDAVLAPPAESAWSSWLLAVL